MGRKGIFEYINIQKQNKINKKGVPYVRHVVVSDNGKQEISKVAQDLRQAGFRWNKLNPHDYFIIDYEFNKPRVQRRIYDALKKINGKLKDEGGQESDYDTIIKEVEKTMEDIKASALPLKEKDELDKKLENIIKGLTNENTASEYFNRIIDFSSKFHSYSTQNIILILAQKPDATYVASKKNWKEKFNRRVVDERDVITINCGNKMYEDPHGSGKYKEYTQWQQDDDKQYQAKVNQGIIRPNPRRDDEIRKRSKIHHLEFDECPVYDISNTEGEPLPELEKSNIKFGHNQVENANILFAIAKKSLEDDGITVTQDPSTAGERGWSRGNRINISPDQTGEMAAQVIFGEWAYDLINNPSTEFSRKLHKQLEEKGELTPQQVAQIKMVIAQTVAATICGYYSVPTSLHPKYMDLLRAQGGLNSKDLVEENTDAIVEISRYIRKKVEQNKPEIVTQMTVASPQ